MNLYKLRKMMGITQREAAELLDCSVISYGKYEREEREPSIDMLKKMARLFNVNVDYLIGNIDELDRNELTEYEKELLTAARNSDERARSDALKLFRINKSTH